MAVLRHDSALFAAHGDLVRQNELADVLEADGRLVQRDVELPGDGIHEVRRRHRPGQPPRYAADALQVKRYQGKDDVGRDEAVAVVDDSEAVGVAFGGQAEVEAFGADDLPQLDQVLLDS